MSSKYYGADLVFSQPQDVVYRVAWTIFHSAAEAVCITNADNKILAVNAAFVDLTGYTADEVIGRDPKLLQSNRHGPDFYAHMWRCLEDRGFWAGELWNRRKGGELFVQRTTLSVVRDGNGNPVNYVAVFSEIRRKDRESESLALGLNYDPLTGLPNRLLVMDRLDRALRKAVRDKAGIAVLYGDIDGFDALNEKFGHVRGDRLLVEAGGALLRCARDSDTVARWARDEFVLIGLDVEGVHNARIWAERVLQRLTSLEVGEGHNLSVSLGVAVFPEAGSDTLTLLSSARAAQEKARQDGGRRICYAASTESETASG